MKACIVFRGVIIAIAGLILNSCSEPDASQGDPQPSPPYNSASEADSPGREWVTRQVQVQIMHREVQVEQDQDSIDSIENLEQIYGNILSEAGVINVDGTDYSIVTKQSDWDIFREEWSDNERLNQLDQALYDFTSTTQLEHCGEDMSATDLSFRYLDTNYDRNKDENFYIEDIPAYLDCEN
ncbi:hypothetical protein [Nocardiopsis baichengensis]|uniref:hypothetical protein n=1 Tax=Nocardiopsis baichengensis TaxID=280240 RepID=UPI001268170E|nr:hypothetical protein [Nocardiopsis baichengensis]